jgi:hypothetical protein
VNGTLEIVLGASLVGALTCYLLTGGADFGAGIWTLFAFGRSGQRQRALIDQAIGPIWEANHVWLIVAVTILFTAFPPAFALIATGLHFRCLSCWSVSFYEEPPLRSGRMTLPHATAAVPSHLYGDTCSPSPASSPLRCSASVSEPWPPAGSQWLLYPPARSSNASLHPGWQLFP